MNSIESDKQIRADLLKIARKVGYANSVEQLVREASTLWAFVEIGPQDDPLKCSEPTVWHNPEEDINPPYSGAFITTTDTLSSCGTTFEVPTLSAEPSVEETPTHFQECRPEISNMARTVLAISGKNGYWSSSNNYHDVINLALLGYTKRAAKSEEEVLLHATEQDRKTARQIARGFGVKNINEGYNKMPGKAYTPPILPPLSGTYDKVPPFVSCDAGQVSVLGNTSALSDAIGLTESTVRDCYKNPRTLCTAKEVESGNLKPVSFQDSEMTKLYHKFVLEKNNYDVCKDEKTATIKQLNDIKEMVKKLSETIDSTPFVK